MTLQKHNDVLEFVRFLKIDILTIYLAHKKFIYYLKCYYLRIF